MNTSKTNLKPFCPTICLLQVLLFLMHLSVHMTAPVRPSLDQNPRTKKLPKEFPEMRTTLLKELVTLGVEVASREKMLSGT